MKITRLAIRKGMTTLALMAVVSILGVVSYLGLPRESTPDVKIPYVIVTAPYRGTSPQDMENIVTRKLEKQLKSLDKLKEMTSYSNEGNSTVVLEFTPDVEMSDALQKVRDAVEMAKPDLPQDVKDDLVVRELSADQWPIMRVVLAGDYDPVALKQVAEDLQDRLEQVKGVLSVDLLGGVEREVKVEVDPDRLRFYGLGLKDVRDAIADENITLPGGEISIGTYEYQVRVPGDLEDYKLINDIVLNPAATEPVYIKDVAKVSFGIKEPTTISRLNGRESVTLSVKKRSGENIIRIA
ncbi:MAG TPA: efflux RND transporter permease subunit, partial [Candidatus Krumholzibacteria bacterium]|nr:efflux RND transporter permease subunit [Candidatus Krumholzibacteria bacterium]